MAGADDCPKVMHCSQIDAPKPVSVTGNSEAWGTYTGCATGTSYIRESAPAERGGHGFHKRTPAPMSRYSRLSSTATAARAHVLFASMAALSPLACCAATNVGS